MATLNEILLNGVPYTIGATGGGQPVPVTLASEMADTTKLYLYLGSETGYEYGYIYAYVNSAWTKTTLYGQGNDGADGFSPSVSVKSTSTGALITATDKDGTTSASVTNGTATQAQVDAWLDAHPEATTTVADGSITKAKLDSELDNTAYLVSAIGAEIVLDKVEYEESTYQIVKNGYTEIQTEGYNPNTGEITTGEATNVRRIDAYYMIAPESNLSIPRGQGVIFYDIKKNFISGIYANSAAQTVTIPAKAYYARFYRRRIDITNPTSYKTNVQVKSIVVQSDSLHTQWNNVDGKEAFVTSVEDAIDGVNHTRRAFKMYDMALQSGKIYPVAQGKTYASNPYVAGSGGSGSITFYDSDKNPITFPSTNNGLWGGFRCASDTTTPQLRGGQYFTINGNVVHGYHIHSNPQEYDFELPSEPAYLKFTFNSGGWSVGDSVFTDEVSDDLQMTLYDTENNYGLMEQIQKTVTDGILTSATNSELGRWMRSNAIMEANKARHALRFASWNIYGASKQKSNWTAVKNTLQNYGIDVIGFQEVSDPLGNGDNKTKFADVVNSWHLSQFSDAVSFDGSARIVASTSEFVYVGGEDVIYTTQANYGHRYYSRNEFRLPRWKAKNWSNYIKVSVYDTQLEVGTSEAYTNARLAQARQLVQAMQNDPNPFIVLVGDFNEMSTDRSTFKVISDAGFTPVLADTSTPTSFRGFYDNIFVNDRISIVNDDVIPYSDNGSGLSDHDLLMADLVFDYSNVIAVKKTGSNCTIGVEDWLDRTITDPVTIEITADEGYTVSAITVGQGDNDLTYNNGAITQSGNIITVYPNLIVGDMWISVTTTANS